MVEMRWRRFLSLSTIVLLCTGLVDSQRPVSFAGTTGGGLGRIVSLSEGRGRSLREAPSEEGKQERPQQRSAGRNVDVVEESGKAANRTETQNKAPENPRPVDQGSSEIVSDAQRLERAVTTETPPVVSQQSQQVASGGEQGATEVPRDAQLWQPQQGGSGGDIVVKVLRAIPQSQQPVESGGDIVGPEIARKKRPQQPRPVVSGGDIVATGLPTGRPQQLTRAESGEDGVPTGIFQERLHQGPESGLGGFLSFLEAALGGSQQAQEVESGEVAVTAEVPTTVPPQQPLEVVVPPAPLPTEFQPQPMDVPPELQVFVPPIDVVTGEIPFEGSQQQPQETGSGEFIADPAAFQEPEVITTVEIESGGGGDGQESTVPIVDGVVDVEPSQGDSSFVTVEEGDVSDSSTSGPGNSFSPPLFEQPGATRPVEDPSSTIVGISQDTPQPADTSNADTIEVVVDSISSGQENSDTPPVDIPEVIGTVEDPSSAVLEVSGDTQLPVDSPNSDAIGGTVDFISSGQENPVTPPVDTPEVSRPVEDSFPTVVDVSGDTQPPMNTFNSDAIGALADLFISGQANPVTPPDESPEVSRPVEDPSPTVVDVSGDTQSPADSPNSDAIGGTVDFISSGQENPVTPPVDTPEVSLPVEDSFPTVVDVSGDTQPPMNTFNSDAIGALADLFISGQANPVTPPDESPEVSRPVEDPSPTVVDVSGDTQPPVDSPNSDAIGAFADFFSSGQVNPVTPDESIEVSRPAEDSPSTIVDSSGDTPPPEDNSNSSPLGNIPDSTSSEEPVSSTQLDNDPDATLPGEDSGSATEGSEGPIKPDVGADASPDGSVSPSLSEGSSGTSVEPEESSTESPSTGEPSTSSPEPQEPSTQTTEAGESSPSPGESEDSSDQTPEAGEPSPSPGEAEEPSDQSPEAGESSPTPGEAEEPSAQPPPADEPSPSPGEVEEPSPLPPPADEPSPSPGESEEPAAQPPEADEASPSPGESEEPTAQPPEGEEPTAQPPEGEEPTPQPPEGEEPSATPPEAEEPSAPVSEAPDASSPEAEAAAKEVSRGVFTAVEESNATVVVEFLVTTENVVALAEGFTFPEERREEFLVKTEERETDGDVVTLKSIAQAALDTKDFRKLAEVLVLSVFPEGDDELTNEFEEVLKDEDLMRQIVDADPRTDFLPSLGRRRLTCNGCTPVNSFTCAHCWTSNVCSRFHWCPSEDAESPSESPLEEQEK